MPVLDRPAAAAVPLISAVRRPPGELVEAVAAGNADLAIGEQLPGFRAPGVSSRVIGTARLTLLVPAAPPPPRLETLWTHRDWLKRFFCPPAGHPVFEVFAREMSRAGIAWKPLLEAPSPLAVAALVREQGGAGLGLMLPGLAVPAGIRAIPLPGFDPVPIVACWSGEGASGLQALLGAIGDSSREPHGPVKHPPRAPKRTRSATHPRRRIRRV